MRPSLACQSNSVMSAQTMLKAVRIMYNVMSDNVYLSLAIRVDQVEEMIPVHYRITGVPLQRVVSQ